MNPFNITLQLSFVKSTFLRSLIERPTNREEIIISDIARSFIGRYVFSPLLFSLPFLFCRIIRIRELRGDSKWKEAESKIEGETFARKASLTRSFHPLTYASSYFSCERDTERRLITIALRAECIAAKI